VAKLCGRDAMQIGRRAAENLAQRDALLLRACQGARAAAKAD
jgi:hypothetical protein